jgi:hypothetical protein
MEELKMKKLLFMLVVVAAFIALLVPLATARTITPNGHMTASWVAPTPSYGDTLAGFRWGLSINGVQTDSGYVSAATRQLADFKTLAHEGDKAVFKIRSEASLGNFSVSSYILSDTCVFDTGGPINPPTGVQLGPVGASLTTPATGTVTAPH